MASKLFSFDQRMNPKIHFIEMLLARTRIKKSKHAKNLAYSHCCPEIYFAFHLSLCFLYFYHSSQQVNKCI